MEIRVRFYALFTEFVPEPEISIHLPEKSTVQDLIEILNRELGDKFSREVGTKIEENQNLQKLIFIGQYSIKNLEGLATPLQNGDTVKFLPPMEGGSGQVRR